MIVTNTTMKQAIWERLTSDPDALDLDYRIDERPADLFALRAAKGERPEIVASLRCLLVEIITGVLESNSTEVARFLHNALPLCDSLAAVECKSALKQILLLDNPSDWDGNLSEIQELASRALVGIQKEDADFRFWVDIAEKANSCLPYALNAAIEIDLDKGMDLVCDVYLHCMQEETTDAVDWTVVYELAKDRYGEKAVERSWHRSCARHEEEADNLQEHPPFVVAKRHGLSHRGKKYLRGGGMRLYEPDFKAVLLGAIQESLHEARKLDEGDSRVAIRAIEEILNRTRMRFSASDLFTTIVDEDVDLEQRAPAKALSAGAKQNEKKPGKKSTKQPSGK